MPPVEAPPAGEPQSGSRLAAARARLGELIGPTHLKLALRATIAGLAAYGLAYGLNLPNGYWSVLTAVVVVQATLGASLAMAIDRALGTVAGGIVGVAGAMFAGSSQMLTVLALAVALFLTAALASRSASFKLAPVTVVIVMLAAPGHAEPWVAGLHRVFEIALGGVVGMACAILILPERALSRLFPYCAKAMRLSARLLELGRDGVLGRGLDPSALDRLNGGVRLLLRQADARIAEVRTEQAGRLSGQADPAPVVRSSRRLWHSVIILLRLADRPLDAAVAAQVAPALEAAVAALGARMRILADRLDALPAPDQDTTEEMARAAVAALEARAAQLNTEGAFGAMSPETLTALFSAVSACQHVRENLDDLAARLAEVEAARQA
ncbi:FUSC family protein [Xanthobacter sp. KR7-65]|uniref:FUSC family protein n=1 Tax=Xanthobacter sp. KR7-65 TaxID=3156612 RepID=UPI0032B5D7A7